MTAPWFESAEDLEAADKAEGRYTAAILGDVGDAWVCRSCGGRSPHLNEHDECPVCVFDRKRQRKAALEIAERIAAVRAKRKGE